MWVYNNKIIESIEDLKDDNAIGFIYIITNTKTGKFYIGKKVLRFKNRKTLSMRQQAKLKTRKKSVVVEKESNWKDYYGSCDELKKDILELGKNKFERKIICLCYSKKEMSYREVEQQVLHKVLESSNSYNGNILGRFFPRDLIVKSNHAE